MKQRFIIANIGAVIAAVSRLSRRRRQAQAPAGRQEAASVPTPRRANGSRLQRIWGPRGAGVRMCRPRSTRPPARTPTFCAAGPPTGGLRARLRRGQRVHPRDTKPCYRPEHWERVRFKTFMGTTSWRLTRLSVLPGRRSPLGLPQEIVQTHNPVLLVSLHQRRIYIDGRPHPPEEQWLGTWFGHSVAAGRATRWSCPPSTSWTRVVGWPCWFTIPDKR